MSKKLVTRPLSPHPICVKQFHGLLQVTMKSKLGQMWDHNGTYMEGIGFRYQDHTVVVDLGEDDNIQGE